MLLHLNIANLALIKQLQLSFPQIDEVGGLVAITGETGAGKSVLLSALGLLSGARADRSVVGSAADAAEVSATLQLPEAIEAHINTALETYGLPECEEGTLVLARSVHAKRGGTLHINGASATRAALQALGNFWIDFHGPQEGARLAQPGTALELIDAHAGTAHLKKCAQYAEGYHAWQALLKRIEAVRAEAELSPEEAAFITTQIENIDGLGLGMEGSLAEAEARITQLESSAKRAQHAQTFAEHLTDLLAYAENALGNLSQAEQAAGQLASIDASSVADINDRLQNLSIELQDITEDTGRICAEALDAEEAQALEAKLNAWLEINRKYGPGIEAVLAKREQLAQRIALQSNRQSVLEGLKNEAAAMEAELAKQASALQRTRLKSAKALTAAATPFMQNLGLKHAALSAEFTREHNLTNRGSHSLEFMFQPNPGRPALPLKKIASSGERARVLLALKTVLAQADATPILVFDEVDANVGGEVGAAVGSQLAALGKHHQVFCVTHLPQVAAQASAHYCVEKHVSPTQTEVNISPLSTQAKRLSEIERMLGGTTKGAKAHAKELLGAR